MTVIDAYQIRRINLGTRITSAVIGAFVAGLLLTGVWGVLRHQVATPHGLNRSVYPAGLSEPALGQEVTTTIDLDFLKREVDLPPVFSIRWDGYWFALEEQKVTLQARANGRVSLYLDAVLVLQHDAAISRGPAAATVTLTPGAHQLVIDYEHPGGSPAMSVDWTPTTAQPRPLPLGRLFIGALNRQDFYLTRAVGWLGWVAFGTWLTLALLLAAGPRLAERGGGALRVRTPVLTRALLGRMETLLFGTHTIYTHIFALSTLAVAQPLFDVVSREPAFFVARNTTTTHLVALVGVVCIGLPAMLVGMEIALARFSATAARVAHGTVLTVLGGAMLMPLLKRAGVVGAAPSIASALLMGGAAALAYRRFGGVRTFVTLLSPAIVVVPVAFLMNTSVREAVVRTNELFSHAPVTNAPPIVIVVFDEFPVTSLLDRNREIDRVRYPNFARLAASATWYRNASSVSSQTLWAVPAIVAGKYPIEPNAVPTRRYFPNNLFTMLSESYHMTVFGRFLQLCPANSCTYDLEVHDSLGDLVADLGIVYLHIVSPDSIAAQLPPILGDWRDFATRREFRNEDGEPRQNDRTEELDRFLETITPDREGRLYFLHTLTPHMPFEYVPSGHRYDAPDYQGTIEDGAGLFISSDPWLPGVLQQRHLLQVGFVDRFIGRLIDRLDAQGLFDEALIIITADHGASFQDGLPRRASTEGTYAEIMLVPLIVKFPGQVAGSISDDNVETIDIVPTIASVLSTTVPYDVDGRSLTDSTQPQRTYKTFVRRGATRVRLEELEPDLDDRFVGLEQKLLHFQSGLYALGPHASLIGRPLSTLEVRTGTESLVRLADPSLFDDVDIESHTLPLFVRGTIADGIEERVSLAIAVNGVVVATTQSYVEQDDWVFASMIPEEALASGGNDVQVFVVDGTGEKPVLSSAQPSPP